MHVVVLGAGVVGVTTAYYLSRHGCEVTVVDRARDVGDGASFANAGQLSYSFTDTLAKPEFLAHIPALMLGRDEGVRVRLTPELVSWDRALSVSAHAGMPGKTRSLCSRSRFAQPS